MHHSNPCGWSSSGNSAIRVDVKPLNPLQTNAVRDAIKRYGIKTLVFFESHETIAAALQREKNIKHWSREWKIDLIAASNPEWRDLYEEIVR